MIKNKRTHSKLKNFFDIRILIIVSILVNVGIMAVIPHHFSFVSMIILLSSAYALTRNSKQAADRGFRLSTRVGFVMSILYVCLTYYWVSRGPHGCSAFFGTYYPCFSFSTLTYPFFELVASSVALLLVARPLFRDVKFFGKIKF